MLRKKSKENHSHEQLDPNSPTIFNFMPDQSGGHALLKQSFVEGVGLGGKTITYGYPRDVKVTETMFGFDDGGEMKKELSVITEPKHRVVIPQGQLSRHSTIVILLPKFRQDLPMEISNTPFGTMLGLYIETLNTQESMIKALTEGSKTKDQIINDINTEGKMMESFRKKIDAIIKDSMKRSLMESEQPTQPRQNKNPF